MRPRELSCGAIAGCHLTVYMIRVWMGPARHILIRIKRRSLFLVTLNVERAAIVCTDEGARLALVFPEVRPDLLFSGCRRR